MARTVGPLDIVSPEVMERIEINRTGARSKGNSNGVKTARYTMWNFIPQNLFEQLSQMSNLYFFVVGLMQMIPAISVTGGLPTMWLPLSQVMIVVAALEGYSDWKRHKSDEQENSQETRHFVTGRNVGNIHLEKEEVQKVTTCNWKELRVGDIVMCLNREPFPADLLLLATSRDDGRAMIETASLDGETNLKFRTVPSGAQRLSGIVQFDPPSARLDSFRGTFSIDLSDPEISSVLTNSPLANSLSGTYKFPISLDNLLLRACKLRNTEWVLGLAIYCGHDTKIYQNGTAPVGKISRIETTSNSLLLVSFLILMSICLFYSIGSAVLAISSVIHGPPFVLPSNIIKRALTRFVSWNLLIVNLIPISLFFFLHISRALQAIVMQKDSSMIDPATSLPVAVRNDRLNSDLGSVRYIFTDKTGTLTFNYMELRKLCIKGRTYEGHDETATLTPHVNLENPHLRNRIQRADQDVVKMFIHMAVNHAVFLESSGSEVQKDQGNASVESRNDIVYSASSADEGALVYGALHFGFSLTAQLGNSLTVRLPSGDEIYIVVLARFEFNSDRKRSSVLVQYKPPGMNEERIVLLTKGADNVIKKLLKPDELETTVVDTTFTEISNFAQSGLRTLCLAQREITREVLDEWLPKYESAVASLNDTETQLLVEEMEKDLELQGAVGVEDKLADEVPEAILKLQAAGIKVIMLTGDKLETAINIGMQARIIPDGAQIIQVVDPLTANTQLRNLVGHVSGSNLPRCFVIDSAALDSVIQSEASLVAPAINACGGVIVCRATPQQKADVVKLVREHHFDSVVTLGIGDGGNDCNMIQSANIGVGIRGVEGLQAFNVSDYGVSRFRDLVPLLLVHGQWNHRRLSKLILYTLSKMIVINFPQIISGLFSFLTPQRIFAESINQFVNPIFSSVTPVVFAVLDFAIPGETAIEYPQSYLHGPDGGHFGIIVYLKYILSAVWHGAVSVLIPYCVLGIQFWDGYGKPADLWMVGTTCFFCALFLMTQKLNFECYASLPAVLIVNIASVGIFFIAIYVLPGVRETAHQIIQSPMFYICWLLTFFIGIFRDYFWKIFKRHRYPTPIHRLQSEVKHPIPSKIRPSRIMRGTLDEFCFFEPPDPTVTEKLHALSRKSY